MATKEHLTMDSSPVTLHCPDCVKPSQLPSIKIGVNILRASAWLLAVRRAAAEEECRGSGRDARGLRLVEPVKQRGGNQIVRTQRFGHRNAKGRS